MTVKKEKKIVEEVPQIPEQPTSNVRSYFTKEITDRMAAMSVKEMEAVMKDIIDSEFWIALLKYTSMRVPLLDLVLRGTDPIAEPSKVSWSQGCMAGLSDVETYIIDLNVPAPVEEGPEENEPAGGRPEGVILG